MKDIGAEERTRQWGRIRWEVPEAVTVGSYQSLIMRYEAGSLGIDENGGIRVSFKSAGDLGMPQVSDPEADHYVSASTRSGLRLKMEASPNGGARPYRMTLFIQVLDGSLFPGEEIRIVFGDRAGGSKGWRFQTHLENRFHFRFEADPFGTRRFAVLPDQPSLPLQNSEPGRWVAVPPSQAVTGQTINLRVKREDILGNPLRELRERPTLAWGKFEADSPLPPERLAIEAEPRPDRGVLHYTLPAPAPGSWRVLIRQADGAESLSNPLRVFAAGVAPATGWFWGDMHGQTSETGGSSGSFAEYFHFARQYGFLDVTGHQGNDLQFDSTMWRKLTEVCEEAYAPGEFVTFQGYEWSGTTPMGGDHNVYIHEENPPLYRSTGWIAEDGRMGEETAPLAKLYDALRGHRAMTIPHIGGRPAALEETDPELERLVELHSHWGTFEWVYQKAFAHGFKVGFVGSSDGHKCRPGVSYPGLSSYGTLGGLTCVLAIEKTRDAFWEALYARRCYATSGQRIMLAVQAMDNHAKSHPIGSEFSTAGAFKVAGTVHGTAPIARIDLLRGGEVLQSMIPQPVTPAADWVLIRLGGARIQGRARKVSWQGTLRVEKAALLAARLHGNYLLNRGISRPDANSVAFDLVSTGDSLNLALKVDLSEAGSTGAAGRLHFESGVFSFEMALEEISSEPQRLFEAALDQFLEVQRCPLEQLPLDAAFAFEVPSPMVRDTPFFVRVRQLDEGKAWSSPWFVSPQ